MTENARVLSAAIKAHLEGLIRGSAAGNGGLLRGDGPVWFEKKDMFEAQIRALDMLELERFSADDPRGALLLTWSGSLLSMGPRGEERAGRRTEYASIELRTDVPHLALSEKGELESDLSLGQPAGLRAGPVSRTSPLLTIAACDPAVRPKSRKKGYAKPRYSSRTGSSGSTGR